MIRPSPLWMLALALAGCGDKDDTGDEPGACQLAGDYAACPECYDGEVTCTYGDTSATEGSCGDCQALGALYRQLCDDGNTDSAEDIEAGTSCSDPVRD